MRWVLHSFVWFLPLFAARFSLLASADCPAILDRAQKAFDDKQFSVAAAELEERCELFRELVSGPGEGLEEVHRRDCGTPSPSGVTRQLWPEPAGRGPYQLARGRAGILHSNAVRAPHSASVISCQSQNDAPTAPPRWATSRKRATSAAGGAPRRPPSAAMS